MLSGKQLRELCLVVERFAVPEKLCLVLERKRLVRRLARRWCPTPLGRLVYRAHKGDFKWLKPLWREILTKRRTDIPWRTRRVLQRLRLLDEHGKCTPAARFLVKQAKAHGVL